MGGVGLLDATCCLHGNFCNIIFHVMEQNPIVYHLCIHYSAEPAVRSSTNIDMLLGIELDTTLLFSHEFFMLSANSRSYYMHA